MAELDRNLFAALQKGIAQLGNRAAIETDNGLVYSGRDLERASAMLANFLQSLQLGVGARVAAHTDKSVEAVLLYLATLRAGYVYLPLNSAYQAGEVEYFLQDAQPELVVCASANFGWVSKIAFGLGVSHVFTLNTDRTGTLLERAAHCSDQHRTVERGRDDLAAILYTSGTTGRSKGAMLTHGNLLSNALVLHDYWGWSGADVLLHALPIFHVHGLFVALHGALLAGSKMIWLAKFDAATVLRFLPQATVLMGVPTFYVRLLQEPELGRETTRNMRLFISGSAPLLIETFEQWRLRTGHTILERYGMSETAMLTSNPYWPDPRNGGSTAVRKGATVGFALPGVSLRIRCADGTLCRAGEVGQIEVKGPNVFAGYWRMPEKTAQEFTSDGYFLTGDVGQQDQQGYVSIVGRNKDLIISGGYNVYPAEIESVINELPQVQESAVVGTPHPDFGEVGVAVVVARPGQVAQAQEILALLKSRLANFKIPKHCVVVPALPRNAMGKVQKNLLREQFLSLFS